jgi:hypothetical protein
MLSQSTGCCHEATCHIATARESQVQPQNAYIGPMPRKPLDLPMQVAKAFIKDMRAFHVEPNAIKRDEIAGRQTWLRASCGLQT